MKKTFLRVAIILLVSLFVVTTVAWAGNGGGGGGGGKGDGSGGGKDKPLELVSSTIKDGAKNVPLAGKFKLEFSKNVTFDSVRLDNQKAFSMVDKDGKAVDIKVVLPESTNDSEKNFVYIEASLKENQQYTLKIAKSLRSKSGDNLEKPIEISFSTIAASGTKGEKTEKSPKTSDNINDYMVVSLGLIIFLAYKGVKIYKEKIN